jgi:hypothetical protein
MMKINQAMAIYRGAVDQTATAAEGRDWWREVQAEVDAVIAAPTKAAAAAIIAWWKSEYEWSQCGDSPARAAGRIRQMAKTVLK